MTALPASVVEPTSAHVRPRGVFALDGSPAKERAIAAIKRAPDNWVCELSEGKRSLQQNAAMWPILNEFSVQLEWPVNGAMTQLSPEEWKDILTAAFRNEAHRIAQGLNGGMVILGMRTRKFNKKEFSDFLEFLNATAAERGVKLPALGCYDDNPF